MNWMKILLNITALSDNVEHVKTLIEKAIDQNKDVTLKDVCLVLGDLVELFELGIIVIPAIPDEKMKTICQGVREALKKFEG